MNFKDYNWMYVTGNVWMVGGLVVVILGEGKWVFFGGLMIFWGMWQVVNASLKIQKQYEEQRKNHSHDA